MFMYRKDILNITEEKRKYFKQLFEMMEEPVILRLLLDDCMESKQLLDYMIELSGLSHMLTIETKASKDREQIPAVYLCNYKGEWKGLSFHGIPAGYELTAFVMGIYNASGKGQEISDETRCKIKSIKKKLHIKVMVTLSCVSCPELVTAVQKIAALNKNVEAEIYDVAHFPALREKYKIKRVPCMVINEGKPMFGCRNLSEVLKIVVD